MINERGGINGRKVNLISLDDGYAPPKTVEQTRRLVESDEVALIFSSIGTAHNASHRSGVRALMRSAVVASGYKAAARGRLYDVPVIRGGGDDEAAVAAIVHVPGSDRSVVSAAEDVGLVVAVEIGGLGNVPVIRDGGNDGSV